MNDLDFGLLTLSTQHINILIRSLCVVSAFVLFLKNDRLKEHNRTYGLFQAFVLCIGFWNLCYIGYMTAADPKRIALFNSLIYVCNSFTAAFYFMFTFTLAYPAAGEKRWFKPLVLAVPVLTALFSMTYMFHGFMFSYGDRVVEGIVRVSETYGPWFYVHLVYSYAIVAAGIFCLFLKLKKKSTPNKTTVSLIIVGSSFLILWNFLFTLILPGETLSTTISGCSHLFCIITIYLALCFDNVERMILQTNKNKEEFIPTPTFLVDTAGFVVFFNPQAEAMLKEQSFPLYKEFPFDAFLARYTRRELPDDIPEFNHGSCFMLDDPRKNNTWYVQKHPLHTKRAVETGCFYTFLNISNISKMMNLLEKYAFRDMLTGVYNRHFFEIKKNAVCEYSPSVMTVIMCDIDNLKKVNDTYGHSEGDKYIKECTHCLLSSIRKKDFVFRMGGDEFLLMLPDSDANTAALIADRIYENFSAIHSDVPADNDFIRGVSIGHATGRIENNKDFVDLVNEADKNMYQNKQRRKSMAAQNHLA